MSARLRFARIAICAAWMATPVFATPVTAAPDTSIAASQPTSSPAEALKKDPRYQRWRVSLTWGLIILITFVTAAAAIIVFSRGFRRWIVREQKQPTADDDVWAMHRSPEVTDEDDGPVPPTTE
ncbi:MAG: hypothetical protein KDA33_07885 [Phycisphaerales bacterium]|nr:hypothetical protein [Phycisphaerales bacterium]